MSDDLTTLLLSADPEADLRAAYTARIEAARRDARPGPLEGRPRILLAGYSGACNTGADLRTGEIVRQLRAEFGADGVEFGVLVLGAYGLPDWGAVTVERITGYAPDSVAALCRRYDAVIVCEGSLFTSTFSDGLAVLLTAFLGMAAALGKPALAYGAEADRMTPAVEAFVRAHADGALLIARNAPSRHRLAALGLPSELGTDTGWSYRPSAAGHADALLRSHGWDGAAEVVALCPTNPFRWPLVADPARALLASLTGEPAVDHHQGMMFFQPASQRCGALLDAIADAVRQHAARNPVAIFPVIVGMEAIDRQACRDLADRLHGPMLIAGDVAPDLLVATLQSAARVVSARYHAVLLAIAAGVPVLGLAYDQRVPALLAEADRSDLVREVSQPDLAVAVASGLETLAKEQRAIRAAFMRLADRQRAAQVAMGQRVATYLRAGWARASTADMPVARR